MAMALALSGGGTAFGCASAACAGWFASGTTPSLAAAHDAYLRSDLAALSASVKEALKDPDEGVRRNALELIEKAYADGRRIPADWKLPREVPKMKVAVRRMHRVDGDGYDMRLYGNMVQPKMITQLQLVKYPDQVVLDLAKGIGTWEESFDPEDGPEFELDGPRYPSAPEEGLYLLNIETRTGAKVAGWVILSGLNSTATPQIAVPTPNQVFETATPTFRWTDFRSPQYHPEERRTLWIGVGESATPESEWKNVYSLFEEGPSRESVEVGSAPGTGPTRLSPGRHVFYLDYKESRRFGDLSVRRESAVIVPFFVSGR